MLRRWAAARKAAWHGAMEATIFSAWIYDTLKPYAQQLCMGHPAKIEGYYRRQEQKRSHRCTHDCRSAAMQPAACLLCVTTTAERLDACYAIATWWYNNRCACRTKWPVC